MAVFDQLDKARSAARAARTTLGEADELLDEDIHGAATLAADAFAVVPTLINGRDPEATLAAAAKLVESVFSDAPTLPGAIVAAISRVARVLAKLKRVVGILRSAFDDHDRAHDLFADCSWGLGIGYGDERWDEWADHRAQALVHARAVETRVNAAIWEARHAVRVHRFYKHRIDVSPPPPRPRERVKEAWMLKDILHTAVHEVDAVMVAILDMFDSVASERRIVREAIWQFRTTR
uniref:Uncharacterized protein n=1 Tax=Leersia perrieri TaxID=77586 RepID=A0A0D9VVC8_9ORYZ